MITNQPKQKTAIRQLIEWIKNDIHRNIPDNVIIAKAKELETVNEQQIIDAYEHNAEGTRYKYGKDYFNETFEI